ncbi:MAG: hypothetical protein QXH80_01505 [Candidatus Nanoarchaeia archaeon]
MNKKNKNWNFFCLGAGNYNFVTSIIHLDYMFYSQLCPKPTRKPFLEICLA